MFLKIYSRRNGHIWNTKGSFWGNKTALLGTIATNGTQVKMPAMEKVVGGVPTEDLEYPWQVWSNSCPINYLSCTIGTSGRRCSQSQLGGRLATTLVDRYFHHYFPFHSIFSIFSIFSPSRPFLIEGVLGSKNLFSESCVKWPHYYREVISDF